MERGNTIKKLMKEFNQKLAEIKEIYRTLETLKKYDESIQLPDPASLLISDGDHTLINANNVTIRPDEFYRLTNTEASELYLKRIGHAVSLGEIYEALVKGGMRFTGDGKRSLNTQLTRATRKFAKIGSGQTNVSFGLQEWYKNRKKIKAEDAGVGNEESELEFEDDATTEENIEQEEIQE